MDRTEAIKERVRALGLRGRYVALCRPCRRVPLKSGYCDTCGEAVEYGTVYNIPGPVRVRRQKQP